MSDEKKRREMLRAEKRRIEHELAAIEMGKVMPHYAQQASQAIDRYQQAAQNAAMASMVNANQARSLDAQQASARQAMSADLGAQVNAHVGRCRCGRGEGDK